MKYPAFLALFLLSSLFLCSPAPAFAADDPLSKPNNFVGIHILFPSELEQAAKLVNSNGGDWGYVTIPIQSGDKDMEKWQAFMNDAKRLHVIPLIRLATQNDPHNTAVWRKPNDYDIIDFANFLSSLSWPTKNKYVILFNEVNRFDEWGGEYPNPAEYADIVSYASKAFKSRDPHFYLILGGMDAAAPNDYSNFINGFTYLADLARISNLNEKIDGFSSHSYPNPAFSASPSERKKVGVATYRFEYDILNTSASKKLPVFITETGWSSKSLPESVISEYYKTTFQDIWGKDKDKIVAITPFLLNAGGAPFDVFSFLLNGREKDNYKTISGIAKTSGNPEKEDTQVIADASSHVLGTESFEKPKEKQKVTFSPLVKMYFKTLFGLR